MEFHCFPSEQLIPYIDRTRKFAVEKYETYLFALFQNVLAEFMEFVPCQGLFVLLDDPKIKLLVDKQNQLVYIAAYGRSISKDIIGKKSPSNSGPMGETYTLGKTNIRKTSEKEKIIIDRFNFPHEASSFLSVPLKIEEAVIGVMMAFDKSDVIGFTLRDLRLAQIFSGYLSTSLQNAIDARKSKELSKRDDLTGLYNDRHFHRQLTDELEASIKNKSPLHLLFLDLDYFKNINDAHGHLVGSQTLKEVGLILKECVVFPDATLARYGGDEYVIIIPNVPLDEAVACAEKIKDAIGNRLFVISLGENDDAFVSFKGSLTASIGVASLHQHVKVSADLLYVKNQFIRLADQAMYLAKDKGKNCVCVAQLG